MAAARRAPRVGRERPRRGAILYATDFSSASRPAMARATEFARRQRAELVVLHVLTPASPLVNRRPPSSWIELLARARAHAQRQLAETVRVAKRSGADVTGRLVEGEPAETIVREARRARADLVVIGTHGRSGLGRMFMGSVAARVLALCRVPVLTVRGHAKRR